ncbi:hypothetical protein [Streptomyces kanamyceticus]|uniref:DUF3995 domain-containing protein n=1 Tax=Streptomyces kanamyceticus TaxID=1967 RepID=A0A5J6GG55_STRKN|nr:hypothetical protein [Streptomyces kanamyceticus]QEU94083.1 hypothetical protein CP970_27105 [Streptomyces kanamyceticus]
MTTSTSLTTPRPPAGRLRTAWRKAHAPVPGVPRWARNAAYAVPLVVLPSTIWRLGAAFSPDADGKDGNLPSWLPGEVYVFLLSALSELLAFAAVGLVAAWGEVFPRWIPWLGGRRVRPLTAVVPAALGAFVLTVMWTALIIGDAMNVTVRGDESPADYPGNQGGWDGILFYAGYLPLVLWGPLLGAVTVAYWRRRVSGSTRTR